MADFTGCDAVEAECGHSFHALCLSTMVNGIEPCSNLCPLCRAKISNARGWRRVSERVSTVAEGAFTDVD
jgi:hypothetical protein